jgi:arsenite methyltransferase
MTLIRCRGACHAPTVRTWTPAPGQTLGDVGFGGGVGLHLLLAATGPGGTVWGVDRSAPMVRRAWRRHREDVRSGRLRLEEGTLEALPVPDGALDGVLTTNTFYFVADLPRACAELARVVRPGGLVAVGIGDPEAMAAMPVTGHGFRLRSVAEVAATLARGGLELVGHSRIGPGDDAYHVLAARRTGPG